MSKRTYQYVLWTQRNVDGEMLNWPRFLMICKDLEEVRAAQNELHHTYGYDEIFAEVVYNYSTLLGRNES